MSTHMTELRDPLSGRNSRFGERWYKETLSSVHRGLTGALEVNEYELRYITGDDVCWNPSTTDGCGCFEPAEFSFRQPCKALGLLPIGRRLVHHQSPNRV